MDKYLMAIDAGTGSVRAVIFDTLGNQISCVQKEWFHKEDPKYPGSMDFDWTENWNLTCYCIKEAIKQSKLDPKQIAAISTTCMREGIVLYDENLKEIWACANVDARSNDEVASLCANYPTLEQKLYKKSGQSFALDAIPRLHWVKNKLPEVYEKIKYIGMFNDWLILKLTGILAVEPSNGSTSGLFDLKTRSFDKDIASLCDIKDNIFPDSIECGSIIGQVNAQGAKDTSLAIGTTVVVGGGDAQLGSIGVGVVENGQAAIFGGSFWQYEYNTNEPLVDPHARVRVNCHAIANMWQFEALAFKPGLVMRWFRDAFCFEEKQKAQQLGVDVYDLLSQKAKDIPAGCYGMQCAFSDIMNFTSWRHSAPTFANFSLDSEKFNKYTFYKAILENTALVTLGHINLVEQCTNHRPEYVVFGGGAAKSPLWSQVLADVLGMEVVVPVVKEATALGAAILAGMGIGIYNDINKCVKDLVHIDKVYKPNFKNHETYIKMFENWQKFYKAQLSLSDQKLTQYMWAAPGL